MEWYPRPVCYRANQSPAPTDTELGFQRILGDLIGTRFQQFPPTPSRPTDRVEQRKKPAARTVGLRNYFRLRDLSFSIYLHHPSSSREGIGYDGSPASPHASIRVPSITELQSYGRKLRRSKQPSPAVTILSSRLK